MVFIVSGPDHTGRPSHRALLLVYEAVVDRLVTGRRIEDDVNGDVAVGVDGDEAMTG